MFPSISRKECGFEKFVPPSVRENMRIKDLRKVLSQSMKLNQNLTAPGQKQLTALQAKLHYMKIVSELKTFGSRVFMVTLLVCFALKFYLMIVPFKTLKIVSAPISMLELKRILQKL